MSSEVVGPQTSGEDVACATPVRDARDGLLGHLHDTERVEGDGTARRVAVKTLGPDVHVLDPEQFQREFDALCRLDHPGLARLVALETGEDGTRVVRQWIEGRPLLEHLAMPPTPAEAEALRRRLDDPDPSAGDDALAARPGGASTGVQTPAAVTDTSPGASRAQLPAAGTGDTAQHTGDAAQQQVTLEPRDAATTADIASPAPAASQQAAADDARPADIRTTVPPDAVASADSLSDGTLSDGALSDSTRASATADADAPLELVFYRLERLLPSLAGGLEHLHRFRKVHGALRPTNVIVDASGRCQLTEYGLVPHLLVTTAHTDLYQAPELVAGQPPTPASDIYALGCILFEAIAGSPAARSCLAAAREAGQPPASLSEIEPRCPAIWVDLIGAMLSSDPRRRPGLDDVRRHVVGTEARPVTIPPSHVSEKSAFFGRQEIVDPLVHAARQVAQQRRMAVRMLEGEPGVGKTAVVEAVAYWASQNGWLVVQGKCHHHESAVYQGFDEVAEQLAALYRQLPDKTRTRLAPLCRDAARLFPCLLSDEVAGDEATGDGDGVADNGAEAAAITPAARLHAIGALRRLIARIAEQRPLLLCLDDVQWASADTVDLLVDFTALPEGVRCLVLAAASPDPKNHALERLQRGLGSGLVEFTTSIVPAFSKSEAREYVLNVAEHLPLELKQSVLRDGQFHPLLLEELIFTAQHEADEPPQRAGRTPPRGTAIAPSAEPAADEPAIERLHRVLQARIASLSRAERLVMQLLTVASGPLSADLLTDVLANELGANQLTDHYGRTIAERLVAMRLAQHVHPRDARAGAAPRYVLTHDVCRKLMLDDIGRDHHAHLCSEIAEALVADDVDTVGLRFEYLMRAGRAQDAAALAPRAATVATERFAFHRAARLWRWLLEQPATIRPTGTRDCLTQLAHAEHNAARFDEAARAFARLVVDELDGRPAPDCDTGGHEAVHHRRFEAEAWLQSGDGEQALAALDDALRRARAGFRRPAFTRPLRTRVGAARRSFVRLFERIDAPIRKPPTAAERAVGELARFVVESSDFLGTALSNRLEVQLARLAHRTRHPGLMALERLYSLPELHFPATLGPAAPRDSLLEQIATLAEADGSPDVHLLLAFARARICHHQGHLDEAERHLDRAHEQLVRAQCPSPVDAARLLDERARVRLSAGDLGGAEALARLILHQHRGDARAGVRARLVLIEIYLLRGQLDDAELELHKAREALDGLEVSLMHVLVARLEARWNVAHARPEVAVARLEMLLDGLHASGSPGCETSRLLLLIGLGQALAALAERQRLLAEPRQAATLRTLRSTVRTLSRRAGSLSSPLRAEIHRLEARCLLLLDRPPRALRAVNEAVSAIKDHASPIEQARCAEARALVALRLERPEARAALEQARALYTHHDVRLPLVLEGWPVPRAHSSLKDDES